MWGGGIWEDPCEGPAGLWARPCPRVLPYLRQRESQEGRQMAQLGRGGSRGWG